MLAEPPSLLKEDPYLSEDPELSGDPAFCAVVQEGGDRYRLATYTTEADADREGARITHRGACGHSGGIPSGPRNSFHSDIARK